jgi:hypothetical protein
VIGAVPALWLRDPVPGHVSFNNEVGGLLNNKLLEQAAHSGCKVVVILITMALLRCA